MNNYNKSKLILVFPIISMSIILMHYWMIRKILDINNYEVNLSNLIFNRSMIFSFIGHILLMICGFVLYGSIRDKDFISYRLLVGTYITLFLLSFINSLLYFSSLIPKLI